MTPADDRPPTVPDPSWWDPEAIPAATVLVVRDSDDGVQALMLRRDRNLSFAGGNWVFPGGRIDPGDHPPEGQDLEAAALRAAVREAREESGLALDPALLRRWSHWTPPPESPRRFTTAFYVAAVPHDAGEIVVDDGEIREFQWRRPDEMLELRDAGEVNLTPPTFITLRQLMEHRDVASATSGSQVVEHFSTRIAIVGDEVIAMYHGDVGYESGEPHSDGPRHRLSMGQRWIYERLP
ncbi:MAG: NUDIX hydrolase [Actinomycetota bacterium]|nr:NUDIX hydrolase [Actinomycetota bacterium]